MATGLPPSRQIVIHGFVNYEGQKMSKSLGNVISPQEIIDEYSLDALRYFVAREFNQFEDTDISWEKLRISYNANLANGLGNLVSRVMKLAESHLVGGSRLTLVLPPQYTDALEKFKVKRAIDFIFEKISILDKEIQETEPFKVIKEDKELGTILILKIIGELYVIARMLLPFMPETSEKISEAIEKHKKPENLFPRKD